MQLSAFLAFSAGIASSYTQSLYAMCLCRGLTGVGLGSLGVVGDFFIGRNFLSFFIYYITFLPFG